MESAIRLPRNILLLKVDKEKRLNCHYFVWYVCEKTFANAKNWIETLKTANKERVLGIKSEDTQPLTRIYLKKSWEKLV